MSSKVVGSALVGFMIGLVFCLIVYFLAPGIYPERIEACRLAGWDTAVADTDYTLYCANLESLRPMRLPSFDPTEACCND